jgi:phosphoesterase RecJ-like protein
VDEPYRPPDEVVSFLEQYGKFLLFGHVEPDGDCVASQLALSSFLQRRGKQVDVFSEGPFDRPEIKPYEHGFRKRVEASDLEGSPAAVILDCSTPDRIGGMGRSIRDLPVLVIDHHASGEVFGDVRWVVPQSPSVTYLIQRLIEAYPDRPTKEEARMLLFGLARDTGFFRHLVENSGYVFAAVGRLVDIGASPRGTYRMIHSGWELAKAKLLALSIQRVEQVLGGRVLVTWQTLEDLRSLGAGLARGSDEVYRILQAVQDVEVVVFIQEEDRDRCSVGLRSNGTWDVGTLARSMGGGGHALAAGYSAAGSIAETRERMLEALTSLLDG